MKTRIFRATVIFEGPEDLVKGLVQKKLQDSVRELGMIGPCVMVEKVQQEDTAECGTSQR